MVVPARFGASGWVAFAFCVLLTLTHVRAQVFTEIAEQIDAFSGATIDTSELQLVEKLTRGNTRGVSEKERFGAAVAVDGDTMVVGMPHEENARNIRGAVYVYGRDVPGDRTSTWNLLQILEAPDGVEGDYFAGSLDIDGDTLVVGASYDGQEEVTVDTGTTIENVFGSVYVFTRSIPGDAASLFSFFANIPNPLRFDSDNFGNDVAVDGDLIVIGAPGKQVTDDGTQVPSNLSGNDPTDDIGAVYVYARRTADDPTSQFMLLDRLEVADRVNYAGAMFGTKVAIDGDTIVASIANDVYNAAIERCVLAYLFVRTNPGEVHSRWEYKTYLGLDSCPTVDDGNGGSRYDHLGHVKPIAIDRDTVVVGAPNHWAETADGSGGTAVRNSAGMAYVFTRDTAGDANSMWSHGLNLRSEIVYEDNDAGKEKFDGNNTNDYFGDSVAIDGEYIVVGAPYKDAHETWLSGSTASNTSDVDQGAVYVFHRSSTTDLTAFILTARFHVVDTDEEEYFGTAVAIDGDVVVVGGDNDIGENLGAVYVFALPYVADEIEVDDTDANAGTPSHPSGPVNNTNATGPAGPSPKGKKSFSQNIELMLSTIISAMIAAPITVLAICAFFFKPWLRRKLLEAGWKNLADTIVPDWKYDVRLIKVEMDKLKDHIAEQSFPRLTNVKPIIRADELKLPPVKDGDVGDSFKIGNPAVGTMTTAVFKGQTVAVNSMFPGGMAVGVPSKVSGAIKKEVATLATLNHPNLRMVKGAVPEKGVVVMEHCKGGSVKEKLLDEEGGGMDKYKTTSVALGAANGLAYLEREGIVHGDMSVDSLHLDENGSAKLGDFGFQQTKKNIEKATSSRSWFGSSTKNLATVAAAKEESPETPGPVNESFDGVDRSFDWSTPINTSLSSWEMFWRGSVWVSNRILPTGPGAVTEGSDDKDPEAEAEKAAWMAPELLKKGKKAKKTPASDVYALGMTLWQLYERRKPYGDATAYEIKVRVLSGERPEFKSSSVPFKIKGIVECCLKEKAKARPAATEVSFMIQEASKEMKQPTRVIDKGVVKHEQRFKA